MDQYWNTDANLMTSEERADLVLAVARVLFVSGQSTDRTVASAERVARSLGLRAKIMPRWRRRLFKFGTGSAGVALETGL